MARTSSDRHSNAHFTQPLGDGARIVAASSSLVQLNLETPGE